MKSFNAQNEQPVIANNLSKSKHHVSFKNVIKIWNKIPTQINLPEDPDPKFKANAFQQQVQNDKLLQQLFI